MNCASLDKAWEVKDHFSHRLKQHQTNFTI